MILASCLDYHWTGIAFHSLFLSSLSKISVQLISSLTCKYPPLNAIVIALLTPSLTHIVTLSHSTTFSAIFYCHVMILCCAIKAMHDSIATPLTSQSISINAFSRLRFFVIFILSTVCTAQVIYAGSFVYFSMNSTLWLTQLQLNWFYRFIPWIFYPCQSPHFPTFFSHFSVQGQ
jgi:hypothetical protein